jgi:Domain of unknown function (DUF4136)
MFLRSGGQEIREAIMKWITLALVGALVGCGSNSPEPRSASASGSGASQSKFTEYKTFAFAPANPPAGGYEVTPRSLEVQERLAPLVKAQLEKRGYAQAANGADLLIKISAGSGELPGDKTQRGNPDEPTPSGFIGIDAYDGRSGATVWHGSGQAELKAEQPIDDALLASGVERILMDFPARAELASNQP